jgi:integrase
MFGNGIGNFPVDEITPEIIEGFLGKLKVSPVTRDNYKRSISRFFAWCIERPRRWAIANPCNEISIDLGERHPPGILTLKQCEDLLQASEREGVVPYTAVCMFGGLRPFEAARLTWDNVNLEDKEIRLDPIQTKTKKGRVMAICPTLLAWLKAYKETPFYPTNCRAKFEAVKTAAGFGNPKVDPTRTKWTVDVLRHTAISHYFRLTGSYGQTAEQFGNSEAIIKAHYQGRVSTSDTKAFYSLKPKATP